MRVYDEGRYCDTPRARHGERVETTFIAEFVSGSRSYSMAREYSANIQDGWPRNPLAARK